MIWPTGWWFCELPDGLIEQHEGFLSLPIAGEDPVDRAELAWQRDRMEWRDVKQADVVMLMALLEREFSFEQRLGNYQPVRTADTAFVVTLRGRPLARRAESPA